MLRKKTGRRRREQEPVVPVERVPGKERTEVHRFTPDQMAEMAKSWAKMQIIGHIFHGEIFEQTVVVDQQNGDLCVFTRMREDRIPAAS